MSAIIEARQHLETHHGTANGYVTLAKKENGKWLQQHCKPEELPEILSAWLGDDVYFSQNTFRIPKRRIEHIEQLRSLFVDIDCYLFNYAPGWVLGHLDTTLFDANTLPIPNLIIFSGRGIVLIWKINPAPKAELPLWNTIQDHFGNSLKSLGGDLKALDAARVFRIAGSVNSKNGEIVHVEYRHDELYDLVQIRDQYLPELIPNAKKKTGKRTKVQRLHWVRTLHFDRLNDLVKLAELRSYKMTGYRETTLFLYRYWQCCFLNDPEEALRHTLDLNSMFAEPLTEREVVNATRSAEKAWEARGNKEADRIARSLGYPGAGYNISNKKLIKWLNLTAEEQQHLKTIIDWREKRKRDSRRLEREEAYRREAGDMPREEYIGQVKEQAKEQAKQRYQKAAELRANGLSQRQIAAILGVAQSTVCRWLKD